MLTLKVDSNIAKLKADIAADQKAIARAAQRGINAAARGLVTDTARIIKDRYPKLKSGEIRAMMAVNLASLQSLRATITARGRPLGLTRFVSGSTKPKKGGGITVQVKGGAAFIPHAFVAQGRDFGGDSRSRVVFIRAKYAPRSKAGASGLVALRTINVPDAMNVNEVRATLAQLINERFDKEFDRQIRLLHGVTPVGVAGVDY